jgi:hypothetical protein
MPLNEATSVHMPGSHAYTVGGLTPGNIPAGPNMSIVDSLPVFGL